MTEDAPRQLPLEMRLSDEARFENFYTSSANLHTVEYLSKTKPGQVVPLIYLWGAMGTGRSHLLQAMCHQSSAAGRASIYIPLAEKQRYHPDMLQGVAELSLVCLDDVDQIAGNKEWELALFNTYNQIIDNGTQLLITANSAPANLKILLADLASRLCSGLIFQLHSLGDTEKRSVLRMRAKKRGMNLNSQAAAYLLLRADRDMHTLMDILGTLDVRSFEEKRLLSIALIKETLKR